MILKSAVPTDQKVDVMIPLLPVAFIILFPVVILVLLIALFPGKLIITLATSSDKPDMVTLYYLEQIADQYPDNAKLQFSLVQQEIALGQWNKAELVLMRLNHIPAYQAEAAWQSYRLKLLQTYSLKPGTPERQIKEAELRLLMANVVHYKLNQAKFLELGNAALSLNMPDLALTAYQNALEIPPSIVDVTVYKKVSRTALLTSRYLEGARYAFRAAEIEPTMDLKREDIKAGLRILSYGNLYDEGFRVIAKLPYDVTNDKEMLVFLTHYALAGNRPDIAERYIKRALILERGDHE